jgi:tRNA pseudouridine13 synthase
MQPFEPPILTAAEPPVPGRLGPNPEHFIVEEIPAYEPSGSGDHLYVWIEKRGLNTADVAKELSRAAKVHPRDVGYAGMKDRNAVTRQWFSVPAQARPVSEWRLPEGAQILSESRHKNKLRTGHLIGNRFVLTLVGGGPLAREIATTRLLGLATKGMGNYFGPQRFGREGKNLEKAYAWLDGKPGGRFDEKLLSSVLQSEVFNRYVGARLSLGKDLLLGEVVRLEGTGKHFVVEDVDKELVRYHANDLHWTAPMLGPKTVQSEHEALELEGKICAELELSPERLERLSKSAPGTRRDVLVRPTKVSVEDGLVEDELVLSFELPSGSYATQLVRELTHGAWLEPR